MKTSPILHMLVPAWGSLVLLLVGIPLSAMGGQPLDGIAPPDVFARVTLVRAELETIRYVMGRPKNPQSEIPVSEASPREVYFQALTLFRKADQLCFEHTRERAEEPPPPDRVPTSADVSQLVEAALDRIRKVKKELAIEQAVVAPIREATKQPTDVFRAIVQANRQLNLLLEKHFTPSDVFQQVTRGVACASRLLEEFPDVTAIPEPPEFVAGKRPSDVYRRLLACFERIQTIARHSGEHVLQFKPDETQMLQAEPSDVYDVASLLVSELAYFNSLAETKPARKAYYPGRRFPSHVYQRAGLLELQLKQLESLVKKNPDWLKRSLSSP